MSVRQSLLAILSRGACYGYQLRTEFDRRTGGTWPLNVGQIYSTLDRLERDGLVAKGESDAQGHVYYEITDAGRADLAGWLEHPVLRSAPPRDELAIKIAVAATLPGVDGRALVRAQRDASAARLAQARRARDEAGAPGSAEAVASVLVADSLVFAAEAEVRWLEHAESVLAQHPDHALELEPTAERPKRGRPPRPVGTASARHEIR
ncbi:PadR family transcriptional regulator [Microbacterium pygmaeum]|uniref:DNA-binding transcriptional regulator, PadR family n=1 Tax=Microbacterium pygmaeum TaxID=370764 RepID=A0A1G8CM38_9MICO|nr:PadR family transcriptional regulator [Microbacterium pygmaeum]SDH46399.1 DNA-binding transcriptional regulator, PadR family [Microbacterium pygmaeum]